MTGIRDLFSYQEDWDSSEESDMGWVKLALCKTDSERIGHNPWLSEFANAQEWAKNRCLDCPVFFDCQKYCEEMPRPRFGVMAGEFYDEISGNPLYEGYVCRDCNQEVSLSQFSAGGKRQSKNEIIARETKPRVLCKACYNKRTAKRQKDVLSGG